VNRRPHHAALFVGLAVLASLSCIEPAERLKVIDSDATVAPPKGPNLPEGLTVEQATALVESSDEFLEPKIAICPKSADHHNIEFWQQQYPALGVLMSQDMVDLGEPGSDPTGYQTVELNANGRMVDPPIATSAAGYEVTIASRRLTGIVGASPTGQDRYDLTFTWQFVPTEIGKMFRLNTEGRLTWVKLELVSGQWRVSDVQVNQGHYGPYDY